MLKGTSYVGLAELRTADLAPPGAYAGILAGKAVWI